MLENTEPKTAITQKIGKSAAFDFKNFGDEKTGGESLVDIMYNKINEVLGGDNANQYFCMTFPGTILAPQTYSFDYKNNQPKPPVF